MLASVPTPDQGETVILEVEDWVGTRYMAEFANRWDEDSPKELSAAQANPAGMRFPDSPPLSSTLMALLVVLWVFTGTVVTIWLFESTDDSLSSRVQRA